MKDLKIYLGILFVISGFIGGFVTVLLSIPAPHNFNHGYFDPGTFLTLGVGLMILTGFALLHED